MIELPMEKIFVLIDMLMLQATFVHINYAKLGQRVVGTWMMSDVRHPRLRSEMSGARRPRLRSEMSGARRPRLRSEMSDARLEILAIDRSDYVCGPQYIPRHHVWPCPSIVLGWITLCLACQDVGFWPDHHTVGTWELSPRHPEYGKMSRHALGSTMHFTNAHVYFLGSNWPHFNLTN